MSDLSDLSEFSSCLLQDTPDYVAYVAKDPVNQRGTVQCVLESFLYCSALFFTIFTVAHCIMDPDYNHQLFRFTSLSVSYPGVLWRFSPECHQHHRPSLWAAVQAVPAQPTQNHDVHGEVAPSPSNITPLWERRTCPHLPTWQHGSSALLPVTHTLSHSLFPAAAI